MAALYKRNVAFKRALDAAAAQKKELQELEEMRECTFKPKIAKSFSARGGGSTRYDMDEDVKMPTRLRHLQVPSHKMFTAFKSPEPNKGERALDAQGGPLDGIAQAFEKLELDLNQRHFVVRALEKENKRLRYASAFARDDVPSAQQSLGGDFDFGLRNKSKTRNRRGRVQASGSSNSPNLRTRRHSRKDQREVGAFVAEDTEAEADMWQAEAEGIIENLSDYIRHSTTYVSSLLWEFDQVRASETGNGKGSDSP